MSRHVNFLPLGSVVRIKGTKDEDYVILQRCGFNKNANGNYELYDYGCAIYPAGIFDDKLYYFNSDKIGKVIFKGYSDEDDKKIVKSMNEYLADNDKYNFSFWDKLSTFWQNFI